MVIVVGGGASGLVAAITAARTGEKVCILERLSRIGKKLLVTGNGRCNLTNTMMTPKQFHSSSGAPIKKVLDRFGYQDTIQFFKDLGVLPLIEGTKVYPLSEQATTILDVLRMEVERLKIKVYTDTKIIAIYQQDNKWYLKTEDKSLFKAEKVIIATGGMTNTSLGCDGLGYQLLKQVGHHISEPFPILVHLLSSEPYCKMIKGTKIKATVKIFVEDSLKREEYGEVLFTEDGLSGPPIFQVSRIASEAQLKKQSVVVALDILTQFSEDELLSELYERIHNYPERTIDELLIGIVHKRLIIPLLKAAAIEKSCRAISQLGYEEILRLIQTLKYFKFKIIGTRSYKFAQVTAGGIKANEIDFETMASKKAPNLYITGEVIDVDGDCGGYNLQWAFATGFIAGEACTR